MRGFYLVLGPGGSLSNIAKRIGSVTPCAAYYRPLPSQPAGEPYEVYAERELDNATIRICIPSYIEEDIRQLVVNTFGDDQIRVLFLTYSDIHFLKHVSRNILNDPTIWIIDNDAIVSGVDFII